MKRKREVKGREEKKGEEGEFEKAVEKKRTGNGEKERSEGSRGEKGRRRERLRRR